MSEELLYRIEELTTTGWEVIDEGDQNVGLTKEQTKQRLGLLIEEGNNPNHLRAVLVQNS